MDGKKILAFVSSKIPKHIKSFLSANECSLDEIDQFIFHQASLMNFRLLTKALKIDEEKVLIDFFEIGNTVSSSIPIALCNALQSGKVKRGDKVLVTGFGSGLSWASALVTL